MARAEVSPRSAWGRAATTCASARSKPTLRRRRWPPRWARRPPASPCWSTATWPSVRHASNPWWRRSRVACRAWRAAICRRARPARPWTTSPAPASGWRRRASIAAPRSSVSAAASRRPGRVRRGDLPARRAFVLCPDDAAGDGRRVGRRQDRRRPARGQEPGRRLSPAGRCSPISAFLADAAGARAAAGLAEVVKSAHRRRSLLDRIEARPAPRRARRAARPESIAGAVRVKADVVARGRARVRPARGPELRPHRRPRARGGVGTAVLHGEAVSLGMIAALDSARRAARRPRSSTRARVARAARLPVDSSAGSTPGARARGLDKKRRGGEIRFVFVPAPPGSARFPWKSPPPTSPRTCSGRSPGRQLDARPLPEYKRAAHHVRSLPTEHHPIGGEARRWCRRRSDGLRRHHASIRSRQRGHDDALPDIQTLAMEFAHLIAQARRTLPSLDAGALEEFTLRTDTLSAGGARADPGVLPGLRRAADGGAWARPGTSCE